MISEKDREWIKEKLRAFYKKDDVDFRYGLVAHMIEKDGPSDTHVYVENYLKKTDYDRKLGELSNEVFNIKLGDTKACDNLSKRIRTLLKKADKEFPGFIKGRGLMISEITGDVMAVRSKGFVGSTRMTRAIREKRLKEHLSEELKKKKPEELLEEFEQEADNLEEGQKTDAWWLAQTVGVLVGMCGKSFLEKNEKRILELSKKIAEKAGEG